jgi:hypothetical protein
METTGLTPAQPFQPTASARVQTALSSPAVWLALLVLGLTARGRQYLGCPSYWYDEAYLLLNVFERSFTELIGPLQYNVVIPPLFLWILRGTYLLAGPSELAMRLPAATAGLAALFLMIPLARYLAGKPGWLWAVGFCAVSDHALMHGCEVRPYTFDLLTTEAVLLAAYAMLAGRRTSGLICLLLLAPIAPWISFPSVFILAGASAALGLLALRLRQVTIWVSWSLLNTLLAVSTLALWHFAARHLYYPGLREHWATGWNGFPDLSSPATAIHWAIQCLVGIGNYGTTGMGIPLLLLGALGLTSLWKRARALAVLLLAPLLAAGLAAFLGRYPMGDRTVFFAVPCLWLLAAAGAGALINRLQGRLAWIGLVVLAAILVPDIVRMTKSVAAVHAKVEYREAFAYVHTHWAPGDRLWVLHPEVHDVYYGRDPKLLGYQTPPEEVERIARAGRLWTIAQPRDSGSPVCAEVFDRLQAAGCVPVLRYQVKGMEVLLYAPPTGSAAR